MQNQFPATANFGSDEFEDATDDPTNQTTHASVGAADGVSGDTSWERLRTPDSPATFIGVETNATPAPGRSSARATGGATDVRPPPEVMSPTLQIYLQDLEGRLQQVQRDVDGMRQDDVFFTI